MKKELKHMKEMLKQLEKLSKLADDESKTANATLYEILKVRGHEPVKIEIETTKKGEAKVRAEGPTISILVALAGLENAILDNAQCPAFIFDKIKAMIIAEEMKP